ncbi:MAG: M16 family metallopeptidase [Candidatus Velthaea sp.]
MLGKVHKAALCAAFAFSTGPALGAAATDAPSTGTLTGGGRYIVHPADGAPVAAVALWYRAPSTGFDTKAAPGIGRLAAAAVAASQPITGTPLGRFVDELGGRIAVTSYPNSIAVSAIVPADRASDVVHAMTVSFFAPVLTPAGLSLAQRDMAEEALYRTFNAEENIGDLLGHALFADGPARYPVLGAPGDIKNISLGQVRAYAERAFRPANAVLVVTGAVDPMVVSAAVPGRAGAPPLPEPELAAHAVPQPAPVATSAAERGVGLGWAGPAITDEREATALDFITDYLFRADTGAVQKTVVPTKAAITGKFVTYHDPGVVLITISGGDVEAARAVVDRALKRVRQPLDAATFGAARSAFEYHMLSDIQTPGELADTFGWYSVEGNPAYAPGAGGVRGKYFAAIAGLTPAFVAATAVKYFDRPGAVVAVTARSTK